MRTLKFIVSGQSIRPDPDCDFSGIVKGTKGYLQAQFSFEKDWKGLARMAVFYKYDKSYPVRIENTVCRIPDEVLTGNTFSVRVTGLRPGFRLQTNKTEVKQDG